jgi:polypyrimidine tract-binding protein 1
MDCFYPVNVEILCSVFQYHGQILKIVIFTKKDQATNVNALIQYADPIAATGAKLMMNGKNLYEGCGILKIQDSNLKDLTIEYNNEKSWDFTRQLPPGPANKQMLPPKGGIMPPAASFTPTTPLFHPGTPEFQPGGSSVLLVSNLNEQKVNPDVLFALFSCYGDVQKVKILFNKRDNALVQFTNGQQASTAMRMLNGVTLFGKSLSINLSNKSSVKAPQPGPEDNASAFNKDYTNSEFHRFKVAGSKNYQNICPPSATLHISNIPQPDSKKLQDLFGQFGKVVNFKFFPNNEKMALVQMSSVSEAVDALVNTHLYPMTESSRLRVSFSKSTV